MVCVVSAVSNEAPHLVSLDGKTTFRDRPDTDVWEPTNLVYYKGRTLQEVDFMSLDHDELWVVSDRVRESLISASWCRFVRLTAQTQDPKKKASMLVDGWVLEITQVLDAVDRSKSTYKPFGEFVLDLDTSGATVLDPALVPGEGVFVQPSGRSRVLMATPSFQDLVGVSNWSGLRFMELP